tara:strand:+ start:1721 stop:1921 length:201 start_codon:yes stop_codon:yes gene_type:complete
MWYIWIFLLIILVLAVLAIVKLSGRPKGDPRDRKKKSEFNIVAKGYPDEEVPKNEVEQRKDEKDGA